MVMSPRWTWKKSPKPVSRGTDKHRRQLPSGRQHGPQALPTITLEGLDLLLVENVGNLICPAAFELGTHYNVVIASVAEGDDKPYKYPAMFRGADVLLLNKMDMVQFQEFDVDYFRHGGGSPESGAGVLPGFCPHRRRHRRLAGLGARRDNHQQSPLTPRITRRDADPICAPAIPPLINRQVSVAFASNKAIPPRVRMRRIIRQLVYVIRSM
jgi:hypothetical protein